MASRSLKVAIIGSGGRESALAHRLSEKGWQVFVMPGNDGMTQWAQRVIVDENDISGVVAQCKHNKIDIVVVGPEAPLINGLADALIEAKIKVFGPTQAAAMLTEGSKANAKTFMRRNSIPTPPFRVFRRSEREAAIKYVQYMISKGKDVVIKVDGLAAGKGVFVCNDETDGITAIDAIVLGDTFGVAGDRIVIEERIEGYELSIMAIVAKGIIRLLPIAMDYKKLSSQPGSPMTGGMGAICPAPNLSTAVLTQCRGIINQYVAALEKNGTPFSGCFFAGIMVTENGPQLLEVNCRFGDPETQAILAVLATPLTHIIESCVNGTLEGITITVKSGAAVCIVAASPGYPGTPEVGGEITGLQSATSLATVYHAATIRENDTWKTAGGRVLNVVAHAIDLPRARTQAYRAVNAAHFPGRQIRTDIGFFEPKH